jgi:hypothetical protein
MGHSYSYRAEPTEAVMVSYQHVCDAKCADPTRCVLALAFRDSVSRALDLKVLLETETVEVRATWTERDATGEARFHRGYLRPARDAIRLLMLTDTNKARMVRLMKPGETLQLHVEEHESCRKQVRSEAAKQAERDRRRELAERRALPPSDPQWLPPAIPRASGKPNPKLTAGTRVAPLAA